MISIIQISFPVLLWSRREGLGTLLSAERERRERSPLPAKRGLGLRSVGQERRGRGLGPLPAEKEGGRRVLGPLPAERKRGRGAVPLLAVEVRYLIEVVMLERSKAWLLK